MIEYKFSETPRDAVLEAGILTLSFITKYIKVVKEGRAKLRKKDYEKLLDTFVDMDNALARLKKLIDYDTK